MHRPLTVRALSLALAFWLPFFMGGAEWIVRCPTHSGGHVGASHAAASQDHAGHDADGQHSSPSNHGSTGHNCSCPGPGCCPPAVAVVPAVSLPLAQIALIHEARAVSTLDLFSSDRDYLLPFATAPPAAAIAPAANFVA
jgi:hypothetical protein